MNKLIYLIPGGEEGEYVWCDDPAPSNECDPDEAICYRLNSDYESLRKQLEEANDRVITLEEALSELVELKIYKDEYGKTERYLEQQPRIWIKAKAILKGE